MDGSDSPRERQSAEYELLKAVYNEDVELNASSEWLDVSIALNPLYDSRNQEVYAKIVLRVQCDENYPERVPKISLSSSKGLSNVQIEALQKSLETEAEKLKGEVMILQLTEHVRDYLHKNNRPGTKSFYDEMILRNTQMEQMRNQNEEVKQFKELEDIKEKISIKEARTEFSSDEENDFSDEEQKTVSTRRVRFMSLTDGGVQRLSNHELACNHRSCKYLQFGTKVLRGRCMEHAEHSVIYYGIDVANGEPSTIREYVLKPQEKQTSKELLSDVLKQLDSIQTELLYLKRFKHENLVTYIDFKHIIERDHVVTYLVQEFVSNLTLTSYGQWDIQTDYTFIRHVVTGLLRALAFLHQHNILHRDLKGSSVYINKDGVVKLSDYSVTKRMEDLQLSCLQIQTGGGRSRAGRGADVLHLATLVLGLLGLPADPTSKPDLPNTVPTQLKDFIDKCYLEENYRWSARQLLEHSFVKLSMPADVATVRRPSASRSTAEAEDTEEEEILQLNIPNDLKSHSRLSSEFRILKYLGAGSFGKVLKAKNRLDGGVYAIKAIELNPRNEQLNRKMIREVKLLSKLNHENVVRYYNSWIETTNVDDTRAVTQVVSTPLQSLTDRPSLREINSVSQRTEVVEEADPDEEDSEDEDNDTESSGNRNQPEASESIVFANSEGGVADSAIEDDVDESFETVKTLRTLYIQMEFCEKSTLKTAIDEGELCNDSQRFWRLVREIIEGLAYIHQQDMIHRDLKPVNIFLDSNDHVKIGDFGLATSVLKNNFIVPSSAVVSDMENSSHLHTEDSHTGGVGTSFYVAPELQKQGGKAHYNKKVDIYSLGIILFEMAHPPFTTYMERCKILSNLRQPEINAPSEMSLRHPPTMDIVKRLLNHDPAKRPTCVEILAGSILPPPLVEDSELQDFIRTTLSNPQSKAYKYLISSCFEQSARVEDDLTFHSDVLASDRSHALLETVLDVVTDVMRRHGARCITTPLFLPQTDQCTMPDACVRLMTHSGSIVLAPRDLRTPLARMIARAGVTHMRRYCVEKIFRERRTHGYHPRESLECAFDIVSPGDELTSDAEVISILQDVINRIPAMKSCNCVVRINHSLLLEAILLSWGLEKLYEPVFRVLCEATEGKYSKMRLTTILESVCGNSQYSVHLSDLFRLEETLNKISSEIIPVVKRKEEAFTKAKKALEELKRIISYAEAMGNKIPFKVCPGIVNTNYRCGGLFFDLCVYGAARKRNKESFEILASGCRYNRLIEDFRRIFVMTGTVPRDLKQSAVGMSISLDKLVKVLKEDTNGISALRVVVCSLGPDLLFNAKTELIRNLRACGVTSYVLQNVESVDDVETYSRENQVSHIIWLKESERGSARVRIWDPDRDRYVERKMTLTDVVESIVRSTRQLSESDLSVRPANIDSSGSQMVNINIIAEEKIPTNNRRRYETQIKSKMASFLSMFSSRPTIEVLGLFLDSKIVKTLAAHLDFADDASDFMSNMKVILETYPRHKKYLSRICDKINSFCSGKENLVVILYSLNDDKFKQVI